MNPENLSLRIQTFMEQHEQQGACNRINMGLVAMHQRRNNRRDGQISIKKLEPIENLHKKNQRAFHNILHFLKS